MIKHGNVSKFLRKDWPKGSWRLCTIAAGLRWSRRAAQTRVGMVPAGSSAFACIRKILQEFGPSFEKPVTVHRSLVRGTIVSNV